MLREGAAQRRACQGGCGQLSTDLEGGAMNDSAAPCRWCARPGFDSDTWLHYPALRPDIAIIRATTADENSTTLTFNQSAILGAIECWRWPRSFKRPQVIIPRCAASAASDYARMTWCGHPRSDAIVRRPTYCKPPRHPTTHLRARYFDRCTPSAAEVQYRPSPARVASELRGGWSVNIGSISATCPASCWRRAARQESHG